MTDIDPQAVTFVRASSPGSSAFFKTAQDRLRVQSAEAQTFARFRVAIPDRRELVTATLVATAEDPFVGTIAARSVDAAGSYQALTWDTRPAVIAGSADRAGTISSKSLSFDVTADVSTALAASKERVAFRLTASSATKQWLRTASVMLVIVTRPISVDPTDLAPTGIVGTQKPAFSWTAPAGITQVQLQISTAADFSAIVYDNTVASTVPRVDTATGPAWAGLAGTRYVRARHFTAAGWSAYQQVEVTFSALTNFVVSNPGAVDADPTPPSVWAPDAAAVEIVSYLDGVRLGTTGLVPGPLGTLTPDLGAARAGQVLKRVHRFYDGQARTQPEFVERITETTFTPTGTVDGLDTLTVDQVDGLPAVDVAWTRGVGVPDEVGLFHGDDLAQTVPGTEPFRDWTVAPNTDLLYGGRAVVNHEHSTTLRTVALRTVVERIWLVDPISEHGFALSGIDGLSIAYGGEVVVHTPIDGAVLLRRTLTRRGPEGTISGLLNPDDTATAWTPAEQLASVEWLADRPERTLRLICGDLNVPVVQSSLQAVFDPEMSFTDRIWHRVSFAFSHAGGR